MSNEKMNESLRDRVVKLATDYCWSTMITPGDVEEQKAKVSDIIRDVYDQAFEEGFDWGYESGVENYER